MQLGSETRSSHTPRLSPRQPLEYFGKLDGPRVGSAWVGRAACIDWSESNIMNSITPDVVSPKLTTCLVDPPTPQKKSLVDPPGIVPHRLFDLGKKLGELQKKREGRL